MTDGEIHEKVLKLVQEKAADAADPDPSSCFVLLGEGGIFDSVTALELVLAIEREFRILVKDDDVTPENLGSVQSIVRFIQAALARAQRLTVVLPPVGYFSMFSLLQFTI